MMPARELLAGKRILVTGVLTRHSIAFSLAERAQQMGAELLLTGFGRSKRMTVRAAASLAVVPDVLELDASRTEDFDALTGELRSRWGSVDGAVHAIAFAPSDALGGNFLATSAESAQAAFRTSAFSFQALARAVAPLMSNGGSLLAFDFDASVAWPAYDWMGVSKAALEAVSRYLARDLGPRRIRVNLVSAGPIDTAAAGGIAGFGDLAAGWARQAPLGWDPRDVLPVADAGCFLLSDLARAVTGEIVHVDGGFHAMGAALSPRSTLRAVAGELQH